MTRMAADFVVLPQYEQSPRAGPSPAPAQQLDGRVDDPLLAPAPSPAPAGIAPDLLAVLRARRDRALAREAARRGAAEVRRERPDLFWTPPRP